MTQVVPFFFLVALDFFNCSVMLERDLIGSPCMLMFSLFFFFFGEQNLCFYVLVIVLVYLHHCRVVLTSKIVLINFSFYLDGWVAIFSNFFYFLFFGVVDEGTTPIHTDLVNR